MITNDKFLTNSNPPPAGSELNFSAQQIEMLYYASEPYVLEIIRTTLSLRIRQRRLAYEMLKSVSDMSTQD